MLCSGMRLISTLASYNRKLPRHRAELPGQAYAYGTTLHTVARSVEFMADPTILEIPCNATLVELPN